MSKDLRHWLLFDQYSLDIAALLFAGIEPDDVECDISIAKQQKHPEVGKALVYQAILERESNDDTGTIKRIRYSDVKPDLMTASSVDINLYYDCWKLSRKDLLKFAASKGLDFPYGCPVPEAESEQGSVVKPIEEIMTASHDNYSENLMEAITVWKALAEISSSDDLKTPRKKADEIIRSRYPEWSQRRVDAITQVVNWTENTEKSSVLSPPRPVTLKNVKESA